jgi:hypothetical protein
MTSHQGNPSFSKHRSRRFWLLYLCAAIGVILGVTFLFSLFAPTPPPIEDTAARRAAELRFAPTLDWSDAESKRRIDVHLQVLADFFDQAKEGTRPFADDALGYSSKWRLIADYVPYTAGGRHERYIRSSFEKHVLVADDLTKVIEQSIAGYLASVQDIENRMLVKMRADIADLPATALPAFCDDATLASAFAAALLQSMKSSQSDLQVDVAREAASVVAGEVLTFVAVKLGVSAGILAAGAGSSWTTFGVGLVVGVVVDQMISWVWNWWADPQGDLAAKMDEQLDFIHQLIVDGDADNPGLRARLTKIQLERVQLRRDAISKLVTAEVP